MNIPDLTTQKIIEVDRLMIDEYGIELFQMMENAGRDLAELTGRILNALLSGRSICVLCGCGNNGGGGIVAAQHLKNRGALVHVIRLAGKLKDVPMKQWGILENMGLRNEPYFELFDTDIIINALIGYGLQRDPRPEVAIWIEKINEAGKPVLALDAPSGLDSNSGTAGRPTVRADVTMTLALPKAGLMVESSHSYVGSLYLADFSVPPGLYGKLELEFQGIFENDTIIKIRE